MQEKRAYAADRMRRPTRTPGKLPLESYVIESSRAVRRDDKGLENAHEITLTPKKASACEALGDLPSNSTIAVQAQNSREEVGAVLAHLERKKGRHNVNVLLHSQGRTIRRRLTEAEILAQATDISRASPQLADYLLKKYEERHGKSLKADQETLRASYPSTESLLKFFHKNHGVRITARQLHKNQPPLFDRFYTLSDIDRKKRKVSFVVGQVKEFGKDDKIIRGVASSMLTDLADAKNPGRIVKGYMGKAPNNLPSVQDAKSALYKGPEHDLYVITQGTAKNYLSATMRDLTREGKPDTLSNVIALSFDKFKHNELYPEETQGWCKEGLLSASRFVASRDAVAIDGKGESRDVPKDRARIFNYMEDNFPDMGKNIREGKASVIFEGSCQAAESLKEMLCAHTGMTTEELQNKGQLFISASDVNRFHNYTDKLYAEKQANKDSGVKQAHENKEAEPQNENKAKSAANVVGRRRCPRTAPQPQAPEAQSGLGKHTQRVMNSRLLLPHAIEVGR